MSVPVQPSRIDSKQISLPSEGKKQLTVSLKNGHFGKTLENYPIKFPPQHWCISKFRCSMVSKKPLHLEFWGPCKIKGPDNPTKSLLESDLHWFTFPLHVSSKKLSPSPKRSGHLACQRLACCQLIHDVLPNHFRHPCGVAGLLADRHCP